MLFNSSEFIFIFLPVMLMLFYAAGFLARSLQIPILFLGSLFFYSQWNLAYLPLLVASILVNLLFGLLLAKHRKRPVLVAGIGFNLALIGWYKYADFFISILNDVLGAGLAPLKLVLPLAISFFTFQQIAFLVDVWRRNVRRIRPLDYGLFVAFFPQLIAGPIVHHSEMMPQFAARVGRMINWPMFASGLALFTVGLFKKTVIADRLAPLADQVFSRAGLSAPLSGVEAWLGTLAYTFQLYFDFSGYSDMAIALGLLFGITLPVNFYSPYKAASIIEFWRCWHMTLSRFLKDYLYIPLGGNRLGPWRRHINLMITMVLGGLWHGAGWTFVIWGTLHGLFLVVNHGWQLLTRRLSLPVLPRWAGVPVTFIAIMVAWVFFRAADTGSALHMLGVMSGLDGGWLPADGYAGIKSTLKAGGYRSGGTWMVLAGSAAAIFALPNTAQYFLEKKRRFFFRPDLVHLAAVLVLWGLIIWLQEDESAFLYFQF